MALNRNHGVAFPYAKGFIPKDKERMDLFIHDELRKLENSIKRVSLLLPQSADAEPDEKLIGMQRFTVSPWNPLGTGSGSWVYWNGTAWVAV